MNKNIVAALAGGFVATVAVGGVAGARFFSGGGTQPEDVLPAATVAFMKVDLDPSAGQKVNVYRLSKKFHGVHVTDKDSLKETLLKSIADGADLDYDKDLASWVGDRAAVAAVAVPGSKDGVVPVVAIQFTDEDKMRTAMTRIEKAATTQVNAATGDAIDGAQPEKSDDDFAYAVRDDYVLVSQDQAEVDAFAKSSDSLSDDATFTADADAIDAGDQIVLGWADVQGVYDALPTAEKKELSAGAPTGSIAVAAHAEPDMIEVTGQTHDLSIKDLDASVLETAQGTGMARDLPADSTVAFSAAGMDKAFASIYQSLTDSGLAHESDFAHMGLNLPEDVQTVLGSETAIGGRVDRGAADPTDEIQVYGRARTTDPDRAIEIIDRVAAEAVFGGDPDPMAMRVEDGGYAFGSSGAALDAVGSGTTLADNARFNQVVDGSGDADSMLYIDVAAIVDFFNGPDGGSEDSDLKPLDALGVSSHVDGGDAEFTVRLSVR